MLASCSSNRGIYGTADASDFLEVLGLVARRMTHDTIGGLPSDQQRSIYEILGDEDGAHEDSVMRHG